jgi:quercetin dioxygenase-like cupin family protein
MILRSLLRPVRSRAGRHGGRGGYHVGWVFEPGDFTSNLDHLVVIEVPTGSEVGEHQHDDDEIYIVLAGQGTIQVDGVRQTIIEGDAVLTGPGQRHRLENDGAELLRILVVNCRVV